MKPTATAFAVETKPLAGLRVLLVEDNWLIAKSIKRLLTDFGCSVIGPTPSVEEAQRLATQEAIDGAVLDINIIGGHSGPVAQLLRDRGCPFFFITGYASPQFLPDALRQCRRLRKPLDPAQLIRAILSDFTR